MSKEFEEVRVIGVNREGIRTRSWTIPGQQDFPLTVSATALPKEWGERFNKAWKEHAYMLKRNARVEGNEIIVSCPPEELQTQIDEIKKVIAEVNAEHRDAVARRGAQHAHLSEAEAAEARKIDEIIDNLEF